jgi:hypothetical protein
MNKAVEEICSQSGLRLLCTQLKATIEKRRNHDDSGESEKKKIGGNGGLRGFGGDGEGEHQDGGINSTSRHRRSR